MKFAIQRACVGNRDVVAIVATCTLNKLQYIIVDDPVDVPEGFIPYGTVGWIELCLGRSITPDYFPTFVKPLLKRKIWFTETWPKIDAHIKPADQYKRYDAKRTGEGYENGPHICSELIEFTNEWRYYVINGKIVSAWWYKGEEELPAPELQLEIPRDWCGTLDVGSTINGLEIIECHHPFSCGWYGDINRAESYLEWLQTGWNYLKIF